MCVRGVSVICASWEMAHSRRVTVAQNSLLTPRRLNFKQVGIKAFGCRCPHEYRSNNRVRAEAT
jgi:hypothetical protein